MARTHQSTPKALAELLVKVLELRSQLAAASASGHALTQLIDQLERTKFDINQRLRRRMHRHFRANPDHSPTCTDQFVFKIMVLVGKMVAQKPELAAPFGATTPASEVVACFYRLISPGSRRR